MARKLAAFVHVEDDEGTSHVFGPDDEVPNWATEKITNPQAWVDDPNVRTVRRYTRRKSTGEAPSSNPGAIQEEISSDSVPSQE
ncbi:MAG: hypothetical protein ACT4NY_09075 [Pseudonocardiales bacterium]